MRKITSLQSLRAILFILVFLSHSINWVLWGRFAVSVFFILSGFLLSLKSDGEKICITVKQSFKNSFFKIRKLYVLHIFMMLAIILLKLPHYIHYDLTEKFQLGGIIFLNSTLLQSWFPWSSVNMSLNGVAWYLSVVLFLYAISPFLLNSIHVFSNRKMIILGAGSIVLQILCCLPFVLFIPDYSSNRIYFWFMYCFPIFRTVDFFCGLILGECFRRKNYVFETNVTLKGTLIEILAILLSLFSVWFIGHYWNNCILKAMTNMTTLFIPPALLYVFCFATQKGLLVRILDCKFLHSLGNISAYTFLIHLVVIEYVNRILKFADLEFVSIKYYLIVLLMFIITIFATITYTVIERRLRRKI